MKRRPINCNTANTVSVKRRLAILLHHFPPSISFQYEGCFWHIRESSPAIVSACYNNYDCPLLHYNNYDCPLLQVNL
jgi:hypothetical protein